jgi:cytochrome P450
MAQERASEQLAMGRSFNFAQLDDPYPALNDMREREPVAATPFGFWRVLRYAHVVELMRHSDAGKRNSRGEVAFAAEGIARGLFMLNQDPPAHTRLRRLVSRAFTPRAVERLRPRIESLVEDLLDRVAPSGEMDVIADLALPVPSTVICEMMGVPLEDRDSFTTWTADSTFGLLGALAPPELLERAQHAQRSLAGYFARLIEVRSGELGDDMLSTMIRAADDGDRLSNAELLVQSSGLLVAGFETTIGLIGNGIRQLILHPDELARLRENPDLIDSCVEECLRFDGPVMGTQRVLQADVEIGGVRIPRDSVVLGSLAAANRDPRQFPDPERFDIGREPNDHVSFGGGVHFCLGAHLARVETRAAIGALVRRFSNLKLASARPEWGRSLFRVLGRLPIRFTSGGRP